MKAKQFYAVYGVILALIVGGAGFFLYRGFSAYSAAVEEFDNRDATIKTLKKAAPFPNAANLDKLTAQVDDYQQQIEELNKALLRFQKPLNMNVKDREFQQILKNKIREFKEYAKARGMGLPDTESDPFYMAMDRYETELPESEIVPLLVYQLDAVERLLKMLADSRVEQLTTLSRETLPGEGDNPPAEEGTVVQKYPISLTFSATHSGFQSFINALSNDDEFFFILRIIRVENEKQEGPIKGAADVGVSRILNKEGVEIPQTEKDELYQLPYDEMMAIIEERGYRVESQDAQVIMGQEKVHAYCIIDLARFEEFIDTEEGAGEAGGPEKKKK